MTTRTRPAFADPASVSTARRAGRLRIPFPRRERSLLLLVAALCLLLRVVHLRALPIFIDESVYTRASQIVGARPGLATLFIQEAPNLGFNPPLFSWLAAPMTRLVADPLLATRLTSALIGTVGMLATWAVGRMLWGAGGGLAAALLYTLSPFVLFYNRMAMLDGLLAACSAAALLFTLRLARGGRRSDAIALGLCLVAGMLTKLFAVNLLLLPALAVLAARPARRGAVLRGAALAIVLGLLPLALLFHNGSGLHGHLSGGSLAHTVDIVRAQAMEWGQSLWFYLTPPILLCALWGLWLARRDRLALLVGAWAIVGCLSIVLVPNKFVAPRYFLYSSIPIVVLAARGLGGLASLASLAGARLRGRAAPLWPLLLCGVGLVSIPAIAADIPTVGAPPHTPLLALDRWQYVTGWPSGGTLLPAIAYLRRQAARHPITVVSEDIPLYMLQVALYREGDITWDEVNFGHAAPLRDALQRAAEATGVTNVYVVDHPPGSGLDWRLQSAHRRPLLGARRLLRVVFASGVGPGGGGVYDIYGVAAQRGRCATLFGVPIAACASP